MQPCRADRTVAGPWNAWLPLLAFALFVGGFVGAYVYVEHIGGAGRFRGVAQFDLWAVLVGALVGLALSSAVYYVVWLAGVVDRTVARETRPITLVAGLCQLPGLVVFLGLRQVATATSSWEEPGQCRLRLVLRLRAELRRCLALLGSFLTLLVVTTGMRRQAFVELAPSKAMPSEAVLLYGLVFAVLLGAFYLVAASAIDARSERLLDQYAPLPDPAAVDFRDQVGRRDTLAGVLGSGGSWRTFQTTVVIAAPLLTALIGSAVGA